VVDSSAVILQFLLNQPALVAEINTRIHAERDTPPVEYHPSQGGCICFKRRGGGIDEEAAVLSPSYQFKIYGADGADFQTESPEASANRIYGILFDVFNFAGNGLIRGVQLEALGQSLREPDSQWVFVLAFFRVQVINSP
jgi:hypothetical protein